VTGGGAGIGAAVAEALGRDGWLVVTMDPLVTLDGAASLPEPEETTAGRIVAAGGAARASSASVADAGAVRTLFEELAAEHGRLDAVVNVAGISRPTSFATGSAEDWRGVLEVHLDGYRNVLEAALPLMATAGHGRILGVTSGSGWRAADAGAYACAKRAVASLTWQLGRRAPSGVTVNAMSPIAVTRMVTAALGRAPSSAAGGSATGGLALGSMPQPEDLGPLAAHLVDDAFSWCSGEVVFVGGSETAIVDRPRLLEAVRTGDAASLGRVLDAVVPTAFAAAEAGQASGGGGNPRFTAAFADDPMAEAPAAAVRSCALITDRPELAGAMTAALGARGVACLPLTARELGAGVGGASALAAAERQVGPIGAVVVALEGARASEAGRAWERILAEHAGIVDAIHVDAGWARAAADHAAAAGRPLRLLTLTDARTAGGQSRAQAAAQLARSAQRATGQRVAAFAVGLEAPAPDAAAVGEVVAHLLCHPEATALSGAELALGSGWFGLRSHPRPISSIAFGGPAVPSWLDEALRP
jgi:NAD(P)-dependent dehydrogenase (short-subunit alcohol dehydrogenase family)